MSEETDVDKELNQFYNYRIFNQFEKKIPVDIKGKSLDYILKAYLLGIEVGKKEQINNEK